MTASRVCASVLACALFGGVAVADPAADVKAAYAAWDAAFNEGAAAKVAAAYADDATFLPATHDVIKGPAGVEDFFASQY
jgi:ketosteroid isomerase-like protein